MSAKSVTIKGFLNDFQTRDQQLPNRRFSFIIGAGASAQSGIPSGKELVAKWLEDLYVGEHAGGMPIEQWATAENLGINGFQYDRAASFYPQVFKRRFHEDPELGYAFLENEMTDKEPSYGYSVLAQILAHTRHQVVITTNFDNLVADALSIYTRTFPFICGHESLTGFVRPHLRHPLIAKIHRDLLLEPINMPEGTATLAPGWVKALSEIFKFYTPIVIGYGGNDGSLMDFLSALEPPITGGIFWCHRIGSEPEEKVKAVVAKHLGRLVPVVGFDELMLQLQQRLKLPDLSSETESRTADRLAAYRKQIETLLAKIHEPGKDSAAEIAKRPVREAATIATERIAMATTERIAMAMSNPIFSHLCGITLLNEYIYQDKYFRREMYFLKDNGFIQPKSPNNSLEFWDELDGKNLAEVAEPTDLGRLTVKLRTKDIPPELLEDKNNLRVYPSDL